MIILLSQSPSRRQAIKVLLGIIQENLSIQLVENFSEIDECLKLQPMRKKVLILDTWYLNDNIKNYLFNLKAHSPQLQTILLLEENSTEVDEWKKYETQILVGNFDPGQFLQIVRGLLMDRGIQSDIE